MDRLEDYYERLYAKHPFKEHIKHILNESKKWNTLHEMVEANPTNYWVCCTETVPQHNTI